MQRVLDPALQWSTFEKKKKKNSVTYDLPEEEKETYDDGVRRQLFPLRRSLLQMGWSRLVIVKVIRFHAHTYDLVLVDVHPLGDGRFQNLLRGGQTAVWTQPKIRALGGVANWK
jgi:hypothetical protein